MVEILKPQPYFAGINLDSLTLIDKTNGFKSINAKTLINCMNIFLQCKKIIKLKNVLLSREKFKNTANGKQKIAMEFLKMEN